jgi:hypothetical protein
MSEVVTSLAHRRREHGAVRCTSSASEYKRRGEAIIIVVVVVDVHARSELALRE